MNLFREGLHKKVDSFHKKNVRVNVIGNLAMFPDDIQEMVQGWIEKTKNNTTITVNVALSYGGRDEIIRAIKKYQVSGIKYQESRIDYGQFQSVSRHRRTAGSGINDKNRRSKTAFRVSHVAAGICGILFYRLTVARVHFKWVWQRSHVVPGTKA